MKIIVAFTYPKKFNLISWAISKIDKSDFSHVVIIISMFGEEVVVQATQHNINITNLNLFKKTHELVDWVNIVVTDEQYNNMCTFICENLGKSYGYVTLLGIAIARMFKTDNPFSDEGKTFICSEFVFNALDGIVDFNGVDYEVDGPKRVWEFLKNERDHYREL